MQASRLGTRIRVVKRLVSDVIDELRDSGEPVPEPICE